MLRKMHRVQDILDFCQGVLRNAWLESPLFSRAEYLQNA